jgi:hypothetical protein
MGYALILEAQQVMLFVMTSKFCVLAWFCFSSLVTTAQSENPFCRTLTAMMAESKTGFPSFKGELKDAKKTNEFLIKNDIIEGSDFAGGTVSLGEPTESKVYNTLIKDNYLMMYTKDIGNFTYTPADSSIYNTFLNFTGSLHQQCFSSYKIEQERIPDYLKIYAIARFVISEKPVMNSNKERDDAKLLNLPVMVVTLEKAIGKNTAIIRVRVQCIVQNS